MASVYQLKITFQQLLRPMVARLAQAGVTANQVTVAALVLSVAHGLWIGLSADTGATRALALLPLTLLLRMALNAIDGMLAREWGQKSRNGAVLNEAGDLISDAALYLPLALVPGISAGFVVVIVVIAMITEALGILAQALGGARNYAGPMGKSDRALGFGLVAILTALTGVGPDLIHAVLVVMVSLSVVTLWNRSRAAMTGARPVGGD